MSRERKRQEIPAWNRPYLQPEQRAAELQNYRVFFIQCIEQCTPFVVEELARDVLPPYAQAFRAETEEYESLSLLYIDKRAEHHQAMAEALLDMTSPADRWRRYRLVQPPFREWADRYKLKVDWALKFALDALLEWTFRNTIFPKFSQPSESEAEVYSATLSPADRRAFLQVRQAVNSERIGWPIVPLGHEHFTTDPLPTRAFEYPAWDNEDERLYDQAVRQKFDQHMKKYLEEIRQRIGALVPAKPITKPERFRILAQYLCGDRSIGQLASQFGKDSSGVQRDLQSAARLIEIPLPNKRGRSRKKRATSS